MKISLYFIFYVVMILELLIFIMERDEATDQVDTDTKQMNALADTLINRFGDSLTIGVPSNSSALVYTRSARMTTGNTGEPSQVILSPIGLWGDEERKNVAFEIFNSQRVLVDVKGSSGAFRLDEPSATGDVVFRASFDRPGVYTFIARCSVQRSIPTYYPSPVRERVESGLKKRLGEDMQVPSRDVRFQITVETAGKPIPPCPNCGGGW